MDNYLGEYNSFKNLLDGEIARLEEIHSSNLVCRKGCMDCCTNLTVFPVEFFSILESLKKSGILPVLNDSATCAFLDRSGECMIYPYRPIICRTHGLPITFRDLDGNADEMAVSFCDKNFIETDTDTYVFNSDNTLNIDVLNETLYTVNCSYIDKLADENLTPEMRIDLRELVRLL